MIVVQLMGGLGNQMFQYSLGRTLASKNKTSLKLDISWFKQVEVVNTQRQYDLGCYAITAETIKRDKLKIINSESVKNRLTDRLFNKNALTAQIEPNSSFHPEILGLPDNTYLQGYWQNEKYFLDIRPQLLREFTPREVSAYTRRTTEEIKQKPSVALHVRRGDYASNPLTNKFHGLTPTQYYVKALDHIQKKAGNLQCFVFSDDVKWCQDNLPFSKNATIVDGNKSYRACEDMYLMRLCDHNIVANSSFSWWGAWLNESPDKIVVAPKVWFQDNLANRESEIVPKDWHKI
jgi:hypothetical protein